ncbi:MAG: bifunctional metallophosphatase/5'-nucleotidase [Bacteroides sp.]|nr:bifunctional metallophosphatase/5'-nucleotidase [Bacteroides sp.]MCM1379912.1 bifunctional metallophosphatase/5'-nucleotidase [Bacteroides sp.]MCM1446234.1 bifunctional metallophosphatase/5'-nucleotidase [Prevotella sp.]
MKLTKFLFSIAAALLMGCAAQNAGDDKLVIIHTNDTHSHIDPLTGNDLGGVVRRKVIIDSIREANPNVLVVDAGDIVQGTLYFHLFKGEVEQQMLNELGYDVQILGNHEFDNGMDALKKMLDKSESTLLASNYDFSESVLDGMFQPYMVKQYGKHKVGIMALNLDPKGMVAEGNYDGVKYMPWKEATEKTVDLLRNKEKCDYVIAVTHIGYSGSDEDPKLFGDVQVAEQTSGIDLIIGGHSHTLLNPAVKVANAEGDSVMIVQTGKYGQYIGEITMDLNNGQLSEKLIPVDSRLDSRRDQALMAKLEPYRAGIDSLYNVTVATVKSDSALTNRSNAMLNFDADFIKNRGEKIYGRKIDGAIGNKGGLRVTWAPGEISEGAAIDMMPFQNKIVILEISGKDLAEAFDVMAARGGDAVAGITSKNQIDPAKTYHIATIDYLANGGDYMVPLTRGTWVAQSQQIAYEDLLDYLKENPVIIPDNTQRFK